MGKNFLKNISKKYTNKKTADAFFNLDLLLLLD